MEGERGRDEIVRCLVSYPLREYISSKKDDDYQQSFSSIRRLSSPSSSSSEVIGGFFLEILTENIVDRLSVAIDGLLW